MVCRSRGNPYPPASLWEARRRTRHTISFDAVLTFSSMAAAAPEGFRAIPPWSPPQQGSRARNHGVNILDVRHAAEEDHHILGFEDDVRSRVGNPFTVSS